MANLRLRQRPPFIPFQDRVRVSSSSDRIVARFAAFACAVVRMFSMKAGSGTFASLGVRNEVRALRIGGAFGAAKTPIGFERTLYPRTYLRTGLCRPCTNAIAASI